MDGDSTRERALTRHDCLKYGALADGGLLAGCAEQGNSTSAGSSTETPTATGTPTEAANRTETESAATEASGSYTASISPVGEVVFDAVPEEVR